MLQSTSCTSFSIINSAFVRAPVLARNSAMTGIGGPIVGPTDLLQEVHQPPQALYRLVQEP